jgi:hypothetical protein
MRLLTIRLLTIRLLTIDDAPAQGRLCQGALQAPKGRISFESIPVPHEEAGDVAERDGIIRYTPSGALLTLTKQRFQIRQNCLVSQYAARHSSPCACVHEQVVACEELEGRRDAILAARDALKGRKGGNGSISDLMRLLMGSLLVQVRLELN